MKNYIKRLLKNVLGLFLLALSTSAFAQWQVVGTEGFSAGISDYTSIGLDGSTPYVIFRDASRSGKATVMKYSGTSWEIVGSAGISVNPISVSNIQIVGGTPYVMFNDANTIGVGTKAFKKWNGTVWEDIGDQSMYGSLQIINNIPYVANGFSLNKFNGTSWEKVSDYLPSTGFGGGKNDLKFDGSTPYVAYTTLNDIFVEKYDGSTFEQVGTAVFAGGVASAPTYISMAVKNGTPYVAFEDASLSKKVTVKKFNGTTWEIVGSAGFSSGEVIYPSLKFNGSTPYVAYGDKGNSTKAVVKKFNGSSWETVGVDGLSAGGAGFTSLAIDNNNTLFIAYQDFPQGGTVTVQKYQDVVTSTPKEDFSINSNTIYPNPTTDKLFLNGNLDSYVIFNVLGIEVDKGLVSGNIINTAHLANGIYHLQLSNNETSSKYKFIKQ